MTNNNFNREYNSPLCEEFAIMTEGAILTSSSSDMLGEFENNDVYNETF